MAQQELGRLIKIPGHRQEDRRAPAARTQTSADATGVRRPRRRRCPKQDIAQRAAGPGYNEKEAAAAIKQLPADIGTSDGIRQAPAVRVPDGAECSGRRRRNNPKRLAQIALVVLLIVGCITVLLPHRRRAVRLRRPWMCTWPFYAEQLLSGSVAATRRRADDAGAGARHVLPTIFLAGLLANNAGDKLIDFPSPHIEQGLLAIRRTG